MIYLKEKISSVIVINKSRFIAVITPVDNALEINDVISQLKKEYPKANHYCSAYIIGDQALNQGSNDDNEPSGTAGVPILEILRAHNLTNVLAVVIRYFGGIKLGAGGLIRAYAQATKECLTQASYYKKITAPVYLIQFNYHLINQIESLLNPNVNYLDKDYGDIVSYTICFPNLDAQVLQTISHLLIDMKQLEDKELLIKWQ